MGFIHVLIVFSLNLSSHLAEIWSDVLLKSNFDLVFDQKLEASDTVRLSHTSCKLSLWYSHFCPLLLLQFLWAFFCCCSCCALQLLIVCAFMSCNGCDLRSDILCCYMMLKMDKYVQKYSWKFRSAQAEFASLSSFSKGFKTLINVSH